MSGTERAPAYTNLDVEQDVTEEQTQKAQQDLLQAQAKYKLRNDVVEAVMTATPILRAVHNVTDASPVERDLLPHVERRDGLAISVAKQASDMNDIRHKMTEVQSETLRTTRKNVDLTAELLELTEQVKRRKTGQWEDGGMQPELARAESDVKASKRRWRIMKGVASGIVAGSGVNWAADESLCELVLDQENEDE
jgi:Tfp pilus assembly major pilin PilA